MVEEHRTPLAAPGLDKRVLHTPHGIALIAMWLVTSVSLVFMLFSGVRSTGQFRAERYVLQTAYVLVLLWHLIRVGSPQKELPDIGPLLLRKVRMGKLLPVLVMALLFVADFFAQDILFPVLVLATLWVLIAWRREIGVRAVLLGLGAAAVAFLAGLPFYQNHYIGRVSFIGLLVFVMPMFVAGGLLAKRIGFVGSQLDAGRFRKAVASLLWGCLLFIPLGLTNAAAGSPGSGMTWVTRWWVPFSQPWFSGIVEETWFRLFLVSLCYLLLRPAFSRHPAIAVVCATLFSGITFGLGHGGSLLENLLITGLLYGFPMAVIFARRDWEHAVGAHYMINMIPTLMVFLKT